MAYKKPGAYARFVRTAGAVNNPGSTKVMALVGTGKAFFEKVNEVAVKEAGNPSALLSKENVYEVHHVTSKPLTKSGEPDLSTGVEYVLGTHYTLEEGKYIAWKAADPVAPIEEPSTDAGNTAFAGQVTVALGSKKHLAKTGRYKIEITYADVAYGTYQVTDMATNEVLGEFPQGAGTVEVIPGYTLIVAKTIVMDDVDTTKAITSVGNYVIVKTTAGVPVAGVPADKAPFYVTYAYKKAEADFAPKLFTDYADVVAEYGDYDVTASGKVINSLALGAEIAFLNGVNPVVLVQAKNDSEYAMERAILQLEKDVKGVANINTVVPLTTSNGVAGDVLTHVEYMSSTAVGKERMVYVGAEPGETFEDSADRAALFNNERLVFVVPGDATKQIRDTVTGKVSTRRVPACFLAVAVAALGLKNDPAEPFTNKLISGFDTLGMLYAESEKNLMAEKGCLVLEQVGPNIKVRHGQTTSVSEVNSNEITLIQIKDHVIEATRKTLGDLYIGRKLLPTVVNDVQITLVNILNQFVGQEIILGFSGVTVKRSKDDPRAIDVKFEIEAVYPLNYINIEFSFSGIS